MSLKVGIVGLPNVGKSTLFNALLKRAQAQVENRPFTTIEPNIGVVDVPDERLQRLHEIVCSTNPNLPNLPKIIPTTIEFVDIAGLVRGAHRGEGLGNQFLSHIREVDAIVHLVRFFEDENVVHVENNLNPRNDLTTVNLELILADLAVVEKLISGAESQAKSHQATLAKDGKIRLSALQKIEAALQAEQLASNVELTEVENQAIAGDNLLTAKPLLVVANLSEAQLPEADELIERFLPGEDALPLCAKTEAELVDLDAGDAAEYLRDLGLSEPGLNRLIATAYQALGLQTFFTAGPKEIRAWTIKIDASAPQAAGVIHTDFERGFIKAEVISYQDYLKYNGEAGAKAAGKLRLEGKDYTVQDGDVCHFRFNI